MAAPSVLSASTVAHNGASLNYTVNYPATVAADDLLVAIIYLRVTVAPTLNAPPAGWNLIRGPSTGIGTLISYWRQATGSETGTVAFSSGTSTVSSTSMLRISGADTTTPIDNSDLRNQATSSSTATFITVDTLDVDRLLLCWGGCSTTTTMNTWNDSLSQHVNASTGSGGTTRAVWGASVSQAVAGTTGNKTANLASTSTSITQTIAIASPAPPPDPDVTVMGPALTFY